MGNRNVTQLEGFLKMQRSNWMTYCLVGVISTLLLHVNLIEGTRVTPTHPFLPTNLRGAVIKRPKPRPFKIQNYLSLDHLC